MTHHDGNCPYTFSTNSTEQHTYCDHLKRMQHILRSDCINHSQYPHTYSAQSKNTELYILHQNMRSLDRNIYDLKGFLEQQKSKRSLLPSMIAISETWLDNDTEATLKKYEIPGFTLETETRTNRRAGGVGIYISNNLSNYFRREDLKIRQAESLWIELPLSATDTVVIGCIYSSPTNRDLNDFIESMDKALEKLNNERKKVIIVGDMNIDLFQIRTTHPYHQMILANGYQNVIMFPTRCTNNTKTLIDHILTNINETAEPISAGCIFNDISDHYSTYIRIPQIPEVRNTTNKMKRFCFKNYTAERVVAAINNTDWSLVTQEEDPDTAYLALAERIKQIQEEHIPIVEFTPETIYKQPYMTNGLRKAQKHRYKLYRKYRKDPTNQMKEREYKRYRNMLCRVQKQAEQEYYQNLLNEATNDQGKTWHLINDIIGKRSKVTLPKTLIHGDTVLNHPQEICNTMNTFFTSIGPELASLITDTNQDPCEYIPHRYEPRSCFFNPVTEEQVFGKLTKINPRKAIGPDGIHPRLVKDIAMEIKAPLCHIINRSLSTGIVPQMLKIAKVTPIFKAGDRRKATNYRPISMLPIFAKVLESFIYDMVSTYMDKENILNKCQYGFQKGKNTKQALITFINNLQRKLDHGEHTVALYLDLKKAFDTVNYKILLAKLNAYGIRGLPLQWFRNYLTNRLQYIQSGETTSSSEEITCGVPQGSNLGPLLFLIYINDLPNCISKCKTILFADDTTIYLSDMKTTTLRNTMNEDLERVSDWLRTNKLTLNINKTYACHFGQRNDHMNNLQINGEEIEFADSVKYLGVNVDKQLNWKAHIAHLTNKINKITGVVWKIRNHLNRPALRTIYMALVHSTLLYGIEIWGQANTTTMKPLLTAQKKLIRMISFSPYLSHTEPLFRQLRIRPLTDEIKYRLALTSIDVVRNPILYDFEYQLDFSHNYLTRYAERNLPHPRVRTTRFGTQGLYARILQTYNSLPDCIKLQTDTTRAKQRIRWEHRTSQ